MGATQRADPVSRRTVVAIIGCAAVIGVILISAAGRFRPEFEAWLEQDFNARLGLTTVVLMLITTGPMLGLAAYLWHFGDAQFVPNDIRRLELDSYETRRW